MTEDKSTGTITAGASPLTITAGASHLTTTAGEPPPAVAHI